MIHIIHFTATKVGGACSHLGSIGPKVGGALAPLALWLPRPCGRLFHNRGLLTALFHLTPHFVKTKERRAKCLRLSFRCSIMTIKSLIYFGAGSLRELEDTIQCRDLFAGIYWSTRVPKNYAIHTASFVHSRVYSHSR